MCNTTQLAVDSIIFEECHVYLKDFTNKQNYWKRSKITFWCRLNRTKIYLCIRQHISLEMIDKNLVVVILNFKSLVVKLLICKLCIIKKRTFLAVILLILHMYIRELYTH